MVREIDLRMLMARIAPALGNGALHDDMAVEDAAHGIRHRLVMVVAVHQHAEDAGDGALLGARPARSSKRGSSVNTVGVSPLAVGGSPADSPISPCAMAKRVTESISTSTSLPRSWKYSAIASVK